MKDFLINVTRYPRYLIALGLGVLSSVVEPLLERRTNPVTAVALVGALISGVLSLALVLRAMVNSQPLV
jgi:xanthosine utilization system XapX-like protein